ncbi:hypothetical protein ACFL0S_02945, partial [Thermodesulfobacteriota bacterium]
SQYLFPERNVATCSFKIGSFATPANPVPVPLASETQLKARLRATSVQLREEYPTFLLIGTIIDGDVVTPTVSGVGPEKSIDFLKKVIEPEINLHNGRLEKLQAVQADRQESLERQLAELQKLEDELSSSDLAPESPLELLAIQIGLDNTRDRVAKIKLELTTLALFNASDLYIDKTLIVQEPRTVYSSKWTRPLVFGAIGLAIGLAIIFVIAATSIIRSIFRRHSSKQESDGVAEGENAPLKSVK